MSLLYRRPDSPVWYVHATRQSTHTTNRALATEYARKVTEAKWREDALGECIRTWADLSAEWHAIKGKRPSFEQDERVIKKFGDHLKTRRVEVLKEITTDVVTTYTRAVKGATSASTANRHITTIRAMIRHAKAKGWFKGHELPHFETYQVQSKEPTWLTMEQFDTVATLLNPWARNIAIVAVQTGLRQANVIGMRWDWVQPNGSVVIVPAVHTKPNRTHTCPLSTKARAVIDSLERTGEYVFKNSDGGSPVDRHNIRHAWDLACFKAGIKCRFHDLRHTWASLHLMNDTPVRVVQEAGGWKSPAMLQRYGHLSQAHIAKYADNVK